MTNIKFPPAFPDSLTAADLDRATNTGRIYKSNRAALAPAGCDQCGRDEASQFPDTISTGYGDDTRPVRVPFIPSYGPLARWFLAARRFWLG